MPSALVSGGWRVESGALLRASGWDERVQGLQASSVSGLLMFVGWSSVVNAKQWGLQRRHTKNTCNRPPTPNPNPNPRHHPLHHPPAQALQGQPLALCEGGAGGAELLPAAGGHAAVQVRRRFGCEGWGGGGGRGWDGGPQGVMMRVMGPWGGWALQSNPILHCTLSFRLHCRCIHLKQVPHPRAAGWDQLQREAHHQGAGHCWGL